MNVASIIEGVTTIFLTWKFWSILVILIGNIDEALYPIASQFPQYMGWYPNFILCINYIPHLIIIIAVAHMFMDNSVFMRITNP